MICYSGRSVAVIGETKDHKEELKAAGGQVQLPAPVRAGLDIPGLVEAVRGGEAPLLDVLAERVNRTDRGRTVNGFGDRRPGGPRITCSTYKNSRL